MSSRSHALAVNHLEVLPAELKCLRLGLDLLGRLRFLFGFLLLRLGLGLVDGV